MYRRNPDRQGGLLFNLPPLATPGTGVVDTHSGLVDTAHIYEEGEDVYQVTLNQTNIGQNNNSRGSLS